MPRINAAPSLPPVAYQSQRPLSRLRATALRRPELPASGRGYSNRRGNDLYDTDGNVTSRQGSSITWASYDNPTLINDTATGESVSFSYGPDRRAFLEETQSPGGTELTYHLGGLLDIVTSGGVTDFRHYIYAGSEPVAIDSRKSSGTNALYYPLSDYQGSVAAITNSGGGLVVGESFTAYGSRRNPATWSGAPSSTDLNTIAGITRHGYTFQDALGQMGLNDMVGRVQDAITGRFLSADPTMPFPMDPQSYNPYSYVGNNPLTLLDPTGFCGVSTGPGGTLPIRIEICQSTLSDDPFGDDARGPAEISNGINPALENITGRGLGYWHPSCTVPYICSPQNPQPPQKPQPQQTKPTQCTALQKVVGTLQNQVADEINGLSLKLRWRLPIWNRVTVLVRRWFGLGKQPI